MLITGFGRTTLGALVAVLFFSAVFTSAARADEGPDYSRSGLYLGAGLGIAVDMALERELDEILVLGARVYETGFVNARVGYRVIPYLATELQFEYVVAFKTEGWRGSVSTHDVMTLTANAKVPVARGRIQPFLLAGGGLYHAKFDYDSDYGDDESLSGFALRAGAGLDFYASEHLLFVLDVTYVLPFGDVRNLDYMSVGFGGQYRF